MNNKKLQLHQVKHFYGMNRVNKEKKEKCLKKKDDRTQL